MGATFLMSYPGRSWHIRGAANFRSTSSQPTNPRAAMREWLGLCDAITKAGGRILVMAPPEVEPPLTGMIYTANSGALFKAGDKYSFVVSKMFVPHRQAERDPIKRFFTEAGLPVAEAAQVWEGQADVTTCPSNRFMLSWGVRSVKESLDEVRKLLPPGARTLDVKLRDPWFHGDTCLNPLTTRSGDSTLLAFPGAFVDKTVVELRGFLGNLADVMAIDEDDALNYACNALCVNGTVLLPAGLSTGLRGQLIKRGFQLEELELGELFGKGGGGPRCLVNELRGFVVTDEAPTYAVLREKLHTLADSYPESASAEKAP
jgi:N-dimethylarginine dimethylaminohydrolase